MKNFVTASQAVIDLHERGYYHDFKLKGNDLLWLQEKSFIRAGDFQIMEYHHFPAGKNNIASISVYGIIALSHNAMGILLRHNAKYNAHQSPVMKKKINDAVVKNNSILNIKISI